MPRRCGGGGSVAVGECEGLLDLARRSTSCRGRTLAPCAVKRLMALKAGRLHYQRCAAAGSRGHRHATAGWPWLCDTGGQDRRSAATGPELNATMRGRCSFSVRECCRANRRLSWIALVTLRRPSCRDGQRPRGSGPRASGYLSRRSRSGGEGETDDVEPVIQIFAETASRDFAGQIAVRGGDDS